MACFAGDTLDGVASDDGIGSSARVRFWISRCFGVGDVPFRRWWGVGETGNFLLQLADLHFLLSAECAEALHFGGGEKWRGARKKDKKRGELCFHLHDDGILHNFIQGTTLI